MLKKLGKSPFVTHILAFLLVTYLRFVRLTTRFTYVPLGLDDVALSLHPFIAAFWHGQHFMGHIAWQHDKPLAALISKHGDGELNAQILRRLGIVAIRGSGGVGDKIRRKGGIPALIAMVRALREGMGIVLTADVPKVSRIAGHGIVRLAQKSGRPILPVAVVFSRRIDLNSWDHASIPLPFGRGVVMLGAPIWVPLEAAPEQQENYRLSVENQLNELHVRAYGLVGAVDPGIMSVLPDTK